MTHLRHLRTGMTWRAPRTPSWKSGVCRRRSPAQKLLLTIAVLGAAASIAGLGTFATFTSSTSASHTVSSGTVTIALGATGASTNRLNVDATAIAPGDTIQRSVDLIDQGTINLASVTLTSLDRGRPALHVHVRRLAVDGAQLTRSDPDRRDSEQPQLSHGGQR